MKSQSGERVKKLQPGEPEKHSYLGMIRWALLCILLLSVSVANAQNKGLDAIIPALSARIQSDWTGLTNIVCDETMTWSGGIAESEMSAFRKIAIGYGITETRDVKTINGQPVPKTGKNAEPFLYSGPVTAFASVLPDNFTFKSGIQLLEGNPVTIIDFEMRPDVSEKIHMTMTGSLWVDTRSLQVVRFEKKTESADRTTVETAEYGTLQIDGKPYLIPKTAKNEVMGRTGIAFANDASYVADYKNCRKSRLSPQQQIVGPQQRFPQK